MHVNLIDIVIMKNEYVIILHGIFRSSFHMRHLARFLNENEYDVLNLDYPSTKFPLQDLVEITWQNICERLTENRTTHLVGYSMGGLLVRAILSKYRPENLGRVVLLATPNKGSEVADFWQNKWIYKKLYGVAGQQLITNQEGIKNLFKPIDYELGVVAGDFSIDPFSSYLIKGKDDGKVSVESTKVKGMKDHVVVSAGHTFFPHNSEVHAQTLHFLKHGNFELEE